MASDEQTKPRPAHPWGKPKRKQRPRLLLLVVAGVLVIIAAAPTIIGHTPLVNHVLTSALEDSQGQIKAGSVSLGWFSDVTMQDVVVNSPDGKLLFEAPAITLDRSLLRLASDAADLGTVRIDQPTLHVHTRIDGSNVEDFLAPWLGEDATQPLTVRVEITNGSIELEDEPTGQGWRSDSIQATYTAEQSAEDLPSISFSASAAVHPASGAPGQLEVALHSRTGGGQQLDITTQSLPLSVFAPILRRVALEDAQLAGRLSTKSTSTWTIASASGASSSVRLSSFETDGKATLTSFNATTQALGNDRMTLARLDLPWSLQYDGKRVRIEKLEARSDAGWITAEGQVEIADWLENNAHQDKQSLLLATLREPLAARGEVDLAYLATMLPNTLRIREGTSIQSGGMRFDLHSTKINGGQRWSGELELSNLVAIDRGQTKQWKQPVQITFAARDAGGWTIDALRCDSDFLQVHASGNRGEMAAEASFNLDKLTAQLGQFVDLSAWELTGRGEATIQLKTTGRKYALDANGTLDALRVATEGQPIAAEPKLVAQLIASGEIEHGVPRSFQNANFRAVSGDDSLEIVLREPIAFPASAPTDSTALSSHRRCVFDIAARGRMKRWLQRVYHWAPLDGWEIDGDSTLNAAVQVEPMAFHIADATLTIDRLQALGPGWQINDPQVELTLHNASFTPADRLMNVGESTLTSNAFAARGRNIALQFPVSGNLRASGEVAYRAMLQRIDGWKTPGPGPPNDWRYAGSAEGILQVRHEGGETSVDLDTTIENCTLYEYVRPTAQSQAGYKTVWQEPTAHFIGKGVYNTASDRLRIESAYVQSDSIDVQLSGIIDHLSTMQTVNLQGTADYDLAKWSPLVASHVGRGVRLTGRDRAVFEIAGRLGDQAKPLVTTASATRRPDGNAPARHWSLQLQGAASAGWESIDLFGLPISAGRISTRLTDGAVAIEPLQVAIGEGRLDASARIDLQTNPAVLLLPKGKILSSIRVTPEITSRMLKYIAPIVADATESDGHFSLELAGGRVPIGEPKNVDVAGTLLVHSVRVMPGPLAREWIQIAEQIEALIKHRQLPQRSSRRTQTWLSVDDRTVDFRVVQGRVHHAGLSFTVGDVQVTSHGSVGFDETLALQLSIPVRDEWAAERPWLRGLKGQTIAVAVHGTFDRPEIDRRALRGVTQKILQSAAQGAIEDQLLRLLDPKR